MKKRIRKIFLLIAINCISSTNAQSFLKGEIITGLGIGIKSTFVGSGATYLLPPLNVNFQYALTNEISIGANFNYMQVGFNYNVSIWQNNPPGYFTYTDKYKWTFLIPGVRSEYHFGKYFKGTNLDVYGGMTLGYNYTYNSFSTNNIYSSKVNYDTPKFGGIILAAFIGGRYNLRDHYGLFCEFGYGLTYLNIGLNYTLRE